MADKLYVTTAIPYVNGKPHIGHALDYLIADTWARYRTKKGDSVRFQIGADEHGNKNAAKAKELGLTPQQFVDQSHLPFREMAQLVGAGFTDFVRTTDEHHTRAVQYIWTKLKPYIYMDEYEGWYCNGCEQFYTDKEVESTNGACPNHQAPYEHIKESNYYLRCSAFSDQIKQAIETDQMKIVPEFRKKEILELIKDGVQDVSISRPVKSLSWGVAVPDDPNHVMYVWIDALSNYLTVLGYPDNPDWNSFWPANLQVVGKDILRFHAIIWPAMLLGLGLELPKVILAHGFVDIDGAKISKSLGNGVDPKDIIDKYGLDTFRYYFLRHIPTLDDGDFSYEKLNSAYNGELANDLGNLVNRIVAMVVKYQSGVLDIRISTRHDEMAYEEAFERFEFDKALDEVWGMIRSLNQYIDQVKPWEIAKASKDNRDEEAHLNEVLVYCVNSITQIGQLLAPFMPITSNYINELFSADTIEMPERPLFPRIIDGGDK
ncbi:methionine--tRNA ligase [Candidatus Saccharibacteria bacterium]|nr:MAG: methionine--tRNA ligase [Candidatus Saccharibacteria bacterium]